MGLELWFREDVVRILASVQETVTASAEGTAGPWVDGRQAEIMSAYHRGFSDALRVVGLAFGVTAAEGGRGPG